MSNIKELSPDIYLLSPNSKITTTTTNPTNSNSNSNSNNGPNIILCGWMDASQKHILKYAASYQLLFPLSSILILRNRQRHFYSFKSTRQKALLPAVKAIKEMSTASSDSKGRFLVHTFSNGGCFTLKNLDEAIMRSKISSNPISSSTSPSTSTSTLNNPPAKVLDAQAFIFDSCPGTVSLSISIRAFTAAIKSPFLKLPASFIVAIVFSLGKIYNFTLRKQPTLAIVAKYLNTNLPTTASRLYLYSDTDLLIPSKDVEAHAQAAREAGAVEVNLVKFKGTQHVAHVRDVKGGEGNEKRYWGAVEELWNRSEERRKENENLE